MALHTVNSAVTTHSLNLSTWSECNTSQQWCLFRLEFCMSLHLYFNLQADLQQLVRMKSNVSLFSSLSAVLKRSMILFLYWDGWVNIQWFPSQLLWFTGSWLFGGNMLWRKDRLGIGETQWQSGILVLVCFLGLECSERHLSWQITCTICPSETIYVKTLEKRMDRGHLASGCSYSFWASSRTYETINGASDYEF